MAKTFSFTPLVLVVLTAAVLLEGTSAATHFVGDATGWTVPTGGASFYSNWAANKTFAVGDILVFNFLTAQHDVARVTANSFGSCDKNAPISLQTNGPANYTLSATGSYYFICTVGQHCLGGQKLNISVNSTSGPTASPPSSPPPSPTPSPSPTTTPPPPASPAPGSPPAQSPPPSGTTSPPTPPAASPPGSPPADTTPPPPPPPSSSSPPKAVAAFAFAFMSIVIGVMF